MDIPSSDEKDLALVVDMPSNDENVFSVLLRVFSVHSVYSVVGHMRETTEYTECTEKTQIRTSAFRSNAAGKSIHFGRLTINRFSSS